MDKITIVCLVLALVPIVYVLWTTRKSIPVVVKRISHSPIQNPQPEDSVKKSEYDCLLEKVNEIEMDFQPNSGTHYSEETYLNRANLLRTETHLYSLINTLKKKA